MVAKTKKEAPVTSLPGEVTGSMNGFPVRHVQVGVLTGSTYNPRKIGEEALAALRVSTTRFGLVQPVVWNKRTQRVVGGHQRLKTLDADDFTDVLEVDLGLDEEKALNLALNNPHAAGEFTSALADLLADLELRVPDLAQDLGLDKLYVDVPAEVDDLLDDATDESKPDESAPAPRGNGGEGKGKDSYGGIKQIVLVLEDDEHEEAINGLDALMRRESCENYTEAVLWLLRNYDRLRYRKETP